MRTVNDKIINRIQVNIREVDKIPIQENPVVIRLELMKTAYRLAEKMPGRFTKIDPAQIDGCYYNDIKYELRFLKEQGLIDFTANRVSMKFQIALTEAGAQWMEEIYRAFSFSEEEKEKRLESLLSKIKR